MTGPEGAAGARTANNTQTVALDPIPAHRQPMLPTTKIAWGLGVAVIGIITIATPIGVLLLIAGTSLVAVGAVQPPAERHRAK